MRYTVFIIYCLFLTFKCIYGSNISQVESLYSDLFLSYNNKLFPLINHNDTVNISTAVGIVSINNFDEISGEIELTMLFYLTWTDERLSWIPSNYGGKSSLLVPPEVVWRPQFYVIQSFDKIQEVSNVSMMVRVYSNGTLMWNFGNVLNLVCSVDVTYFPFDTQTCEITVSGWAYTTDEVQFYTTQERLKRDFLNSNSQWLLQAATVRNNTFNGQSFPPSFKISIALKRRSDFFVVYIIIPIVFLGSINNLVFIMPASSGERTSVAITAFLSFVVYMEMVNANVPESSSPMAYIYYYILFLMIYSSVIMFMCIISLRIYDKDGEVSSGVKKIIYVLRWWRLLKWQRKAKVVPERKLSTASEVLGEKDKYISEEVVNEEEKSDAVTWKLVGKTYDKYCYLALSIVFWGHTSYMFINLPNNQI